MTSKRGRKPRARELARRAQELGQHPLGDTLLEDLAAASRAGPASVRVIEGEDGNPVVLSRDPDRGRHMQRVLRDARSVHLQHIPDLTESDFELLATQADKRLGANGDDDE